MALALASVGRFVSAGWNPSHMDGYPYKNLTSAVKDQRSPLRAYFNRRFPNLKPIQAQYRDGAGPLLVKGGTANPGTLGGAFDLMVRFVVDPSYSATIATAGFTGFESEVVEHLAGVAGMATETADEQLLARAAWALSLCTEVTRVGLMPGSPLASLVGTQKFTKVALLELAPDEAIEQLRHLIGIAHERLLPDIARATKIHLGPTFDGSKLCAADADLIYDGVLLELKTKVGSAPNKAGQRHDVLPAEDLYQLVAYALFDHSDAFEIHSLALYSARYGHRSIWPLEKGLSELAGTPIDVAQERETVWKLLGGRP